MIWIVALIILIIIGNFIWLLPSKSERRPHEAQEQGHYEGPDLS